MLALRRDLLIFFRDLSALDRIVRLNMTDFSQYEAIILKRATVFVVICVMLFIVCCVGIVLVKKWAKDSQERDDKISYRILLVICLAFAVLSAGLVVGTIHAANYDIQNQAYVVYEGEFEVVNTKSGANVFITPRKIIQLEWLEWGGCYVEDGFYNGKVLYSEKTRIVFEVEFD